MQSSLAAVVLEQLLQLAVQAVVAQVVTLLVGLILQVL
jgi:hypothetical protein